MKVGMVSASMSRRAGGLFHSVRELSRSLAELEVGVEVFAGHDADSKYDLDAWGQTPMHVLPVLGPASFGFQPGLSRAMDRLGPDVLHLHGLWMYCSDAARRQSRRSGAYFISPRGMLEPWAVRNSVLKKKLASVLYEARNLRAATCLHALTKAELRGIRAYGLKAPVAVIPNGVDPSIADGAWEVPAWRNRLPEDARVLLFLARIHPKKGLPLLIEAISLVRSGGSEPWHLVVAGWDEGGHQALVERAVVEAGLEERVHFVGPQVGDEKLASFAVADAFVLPSHSEGLPMAVLEAWAFRLPVVMTSCCNLPEGEECDAAFVVDPSPSALALGLEQLFALREVDRKRMGSRGRDLVEARFSWREIALRTCQSYRWALGLCPRPDFVEVARP